MSTLDEIAKLSGFSKTTVSRVLNHSPHVSPETREKILAIMKEMDYVPNRNAISLSKGQTQQIGMITMDLSELILRFMNGFVEISGRYGFQTIIYTTGGDRQKELQAFEDLKEKSRRPAHSDLRERYECHFFLLQIWADCVVAAHGPS